ncbi:hypothetical protein LUZ60_009366 [Juncus effusus]|nr:hypothetical protein LUZ60_009366 [Juncus effusus]
MVQDQALHKCNSNNGKKNKGKKVPQRGLGVAQLERLRLEEQKKLHNAASSSSSSNLFTPALHFLPSHNPPFPSPPPPPPDFQLSPSSTSPVSSSDWRSHNLSTSWKHPQLHRTFVPSTNSGSGYLPLIEPPSNQMFSSDSSSSLLSFGDDKEIVGTKRPPFNLDTIANPLQCKFPKILRPNVMSPYGNDYIGFDFGSKTTTYSTRTSNNKRLKEDSKTCDGGFLTLGITTSQAVSMPPVQANNEECSWNFTHSKTMFSFMPETESICEKPQQEWTPPVHDTLDLNLKL